ncbi:hypothetical protein Tco_0914512 [Tanacetum coccineum]
MKIQAGIQVLRRGELRRQLSLWKPLEDYITLLFVLVRNIFAGEEVGGAEGFDGGEFGVEGCGSKCLIFEEIDDEDVPLVDGVLDGALGAFGDRGCYFGDGILASSCVRLMNNFLGEIIMIFGFLEALEVEVCEDAMEEFEVEDE